MQSDMMLILSGLCDGDMHRKVGVKYYYITINQPLHDKTNKMTVHPAKTQISLGIHPV